MLKMQRSAYIAAMEPLRFEAIFGESEILSVVGSGSGERILCDILRLCPDFLLLDGVLSGVDSLNLLDQLGACMPAPPRVLYLGREKKWLEPALRKGADAAELCNKNNRELLLLAERTAQESLPNLAAPWEADRLEIAGHYASILGIPQSMRGNHYIILSLALLSCAPQLGVSYTGLLYPLVASSCNTSARAVEKAIRTAVENTWLHGDLNAIQSLFGYSVDADRGKPTNAEFLSMLTGYVQRELAHRMEKKARNSPEKMVKFPEFA